MRATGGTWTCANWTPTGSSDVVLRAALDSGDPCTHRVVEVPGDAWTCQTTIAPPPIVLNAAERSRHPFLFADLSLRPVTRRTAASVCTQEVRPSPGGGPWHCMTWFRVDPRQHFRVLRAIDPGGPCTLRAVDESTGVWICQTGGGNDAAPAPTDEVYYGDTAMAKPGRGKRWARQLCVAEIRASPDGGAWTCASWMGYDSGALIRAAHDPGRPCTHRVVQPPRGHVDVRDDDSGAAVDARHGEPPEASTPLRRPDADVAPVGLGLHAGDPYVADRRAVEVHDVDAARPVRALAADPADRSRWPVHGPHGRRAHGRLGVR